VDVGVSQNTRIPTTPKLAEKGVNMALTDATVKTAKAKEKDYKLSDAGGLYLYVSKTGGKLWRDNISSLYELVNN
jgi:hypothetical protein